MALNYDYDAHFEDRPIDRISVYTEKDVLELSFKNSNDQIRD